ncbi:MAG: hypothetical protein K2H41_04310 [Acetatifactor sp.]|nr:hypothetical protein [Acetatifactor sp.]
MKNKVAAILCVGIIALSGCAQSEQVRQIEPERQTETERQTQTEPHTETAPLTSTEESTADRPDLDGTLYIGEYLDSDVMDPNLEIAEDEDGQYIVQIGIFRLTSIEGVGELTEDGMRFTATDAAGNPISGVITVEDQTATVTFTDSTWTYLPNGSSYQYTKSSDTPNLW